MIVGGDLNKIQMHSNSISLTQSCQFCIEDYVDFPQITEATKLVSLYVFIAAQTI